MTLMDLIIINKNLTIHRHYALSFINTKAVITFLGMTNKTNRLICVQKTSIRSFIGSCSFILNFRMESILHSLGTKYSVPSNELFLEEYPRPKINKTQLYALINYLKL